jgi:hypothetical protein
MKAEPPVDQILRLFRLLRLIRKKDYNERM